MGLLKFINQYDRRIGLAIIYLIISLAVTLTWFLYVDPSFKIRGFVLSLSILLMMFLIFKLIFKEFPNTFGKFLTLMVVGAIIIGWFFRGYNILSGNILENFQSSVNSQIILFATSPFLVPLVTLALVFVASEKLSHELEMKSKFDMLTKTLSRGAIIEEIDKEVLRSARNHSVFSLLVLDLDNFKQINDTQGHQYGDSVLVSFAHGVANLLRQIDFFGRMGGDEFVILLPGVDPQAAQGVVNRIQDESIKNSSYKWAVSVGVACWQGPQDTTDSMIARADQALYAVKRSKKCS